MTHMRTALTFTSGFLAITAAAVVAMPAATATLTPQPKICASTNAGSTCRSPGDVEINVPRRAAEFYPYGFLPYPLGGHR